MISVVCAVSRAHVLHCIGEIEHDFDDRTNTNAHMRWWSDRTARNLHRVQVRWFAGSHRDQRKTWWRSTDRQGWIDVCSKLGRCFLCVCSCKTEWIPVWFDIGLRRSWSDVHTRQRAWVILKKDHAQLLSFSVVRSHQIVSVFVFIRQQNMFCQRIVWSGWERQLVNDVTHGSNDHTRCSVQLPDPADHSQHRRKSLRGGPRRTTEVTQNWHGVMRQHQRKKREPWQDWVRADRKRKPQQDAGVLWRGRLKAREMGKVENAQQVAGELLTEKTGSKWKTRNQQQIAGELLTGNCATTVPTEMWEELGLNTRGSQAHWEAASGGTETRRHHCSRRETARHKDQQWAESPWGASC